MARSSIARATCASDCSRRRPPEARPKTFETERADMRRVVVTGMGIVSSIGNNSDEVTQSLREARSGISFSQDFADHGFRCQVWGAPALDPTELVDRRAMRFL